MEIGTSVELLKPLFGEFRSEYRHLRTKYLLISVEPWVLRRGTRSTRTTRARGPVLDLLNVVLRTEPC